MSVLLGIDVGTTGTKALLLDPERGVVAEAERPSSLHSLHAGWAEEDTGEWWANVCATTRELLDGFDGEVAGVGVTGMVPCTIPLDEHGVPLRWSIQQNDARSVAEVEELRRRLAGADVLERTGSAITQQSTGPRLLWLAEHEPEVWSKTRTLMGSYDYIAMRLSGERSVEANWALETGLLDFAAMRWADDVLEACGGRTGAAPAGAPLRRGRRRRDCRRRRRDRAQDGRAGGRRHGRPYRVHLRLRRARGRRPARQARRRRRHHARRRRPVRRRTPVPRLPPAAGALRAQRLHGHQRQPDQVVPARVRRRRRPRAARRRGRAGTARLGGVLCLPYFLGEKTPINDPEATGALVGLRLTHTRGHLFRAVLEGIAFGFRHHLEVFAERGHRPLRARVTDGGSRSRVWTQITADVLGLPLEKVTLRSGSAFAAAFCAGRGVGVFPDWRDIDRFVTVDEVIEPQHYDVYDESYRAYRELYPTLKGVLG